MSNLRERAREIKDAAAAERGNFEPTGAPKRIYNWWLEESPGKKARDIKYGVRKENFCHFWRVVLIWAPAMWVLAVVFDFLDSTLGKVISVGVLVTALIVGLYLAGGLLEFAVAIAAGAAILAAAGGIAFGLFKLHERFWNSAWNNMAAKIAVGALFTAMGGLIVVSIVLATLDIGLIFLAYLAGGFMAIGLTVAFFVTLSNFIAGRRRLKKEKAREAENEYYETHGEFPRRPVREPSKFGQAIGQFFSGLADFMILTTQIVRVKKWKICPLVEVDTNERYEEYA